MGTASPPHRAATQSASTVATLVLETLRLHPTNSSDLVQRWLNADTRGLLSLMIREGGELWLYRRLCQLGLAETTFGTTPFWLQLERVARKTVAQNLLVRSHAESVIDVLQSEGIRVIPIKGIARIALATEFPFADCRSTNDVDLIVQPDQQQHAWQVLRDRGYRQASDHTPPGHYHLPPLADRSRIPVELHTSTASGVPAEEAWRRSVAAGDATELLWQGWMHGMAQGLEAYFLRYFLDAGVALVDPAAVNWTVITQRLHSSETEDLASASTWLRAANYFGGQTLPPQILSNGPPFALHRAYTWRIRTFRSRLKGRAWTRKLLAEALRCEFRMGIEGPAPSAPVVYKTRRAISAVAARLAYRAWRTLQSDNGVV